MNESHSEEKTKAKRDLKNLGSFLNLYASLYQLIHSAHGKCYIIICSNPRCLSTFKTVISKMKFFVLSVFYSLFTPSFSTIMQILKLLDNEDMDPSALDGIKDDIDYYIEVQTTRATVISLLINTLRPSFSAPLYKRRY